MLASLAKLRAETPARGSLPRCLQCRGLHVAGQSPGFFAGARAYHDALPDAFCGCDRCADLSEEYRDEYEQAELSRLKQHATLPDWTGMPPNYRKTNCHDGLLLGDDPLGDSSDESDGYHGDDVGNYLGMDDDCGDD